MLAVELVVAALVGAMVLVPALPPATVLLVLTLQERSPPNLSANRVGGGQHSRCPSALIMKSVAEQHNPAQPQSGPNLTRPPCRMPLMSHSAMTWRPWLSQPAATSARPSADTSSAARRDACAACGRRLSCQQPT